MRAFLKSFIYAFKGIYFSVHTHRNIKVHLLAAIVAISLAIYLSVPASHLLSVILISAIIIAMESVNTAIELLVDQISPDYHVYYGRVKDIMAGAVLILSIFSLFIAWIVFKDPLMRLFQ